MTEIPYAEYGVAIFAIATLGAVIYAFLKHLSKKDERMEGMAKDFTGVINNHLSESKEINQKLIASNDRLAEGHQRLENTLERLADKL